MTGRTRLAIGAVIALAAGAGCNALLGLHELEYRGPAGDDGGVDGAVPLPDGGSSTLAAACASMAAAYCQYADRCFGLLGTGQTSGGPDTIAHCTTFTGKTCVNQYGVPGSNVRPSDIDCLTRAYTSTSCLDSTSVGLDCRLPPGVSGDAEPCAGSGQCMSGYCASTGSGGCGICSPYMIQKVPAGGSCLSQGPGVYLYCAPGSQCIGTVCTAVALEGESCSDAKPCLIDNYTAVDQMMLACVNGTCVRTGQTGQPCVGTNQLCARGNACNGSGVCAPIRHVALGASCKPVGDETVDCAEGYCTNNCPISDCGCTGAQPADWTCKPYPAAGASCGTYRQCGQTYDCADGLACIKGFCAAATAPAVPTACGP